MGVVLRRQLRAQRVEGGGEQLGWGLGAQLDEKPGALLRGQGRQHPVQDAAHLVRAERGDDALLQGDQLGVAVGFPQQTVVVALFLLHVLEVLGDEACDAAIEAVGDIAPTQGRQVGDLFGQAVQLVHFLAMQAVRRRAVAGRAGPALLQGGMHHGVLMLDVRAAEGQQVLQPGEHGAGLAAVLPVAAAEGAEGMDQVGAQALVDQRIDIETGGGGRHRRTPRWWSEEVHARARRFGGLRNKP
ncbi:hypothetical protein I0E98_21015 [Pseudomonas lalucatii]|nr:hypothetical protein [Pseudomonas lalucatii]